jgi:hypothetical protein
MHSLSAWTPRESSQKPMTMPSASIANAVLSLRMPLPSLVALAIGVFAGQTARLGRRSGDIRERWRREANSPATAYGQLGTPCAAKRV